MYHETFTRRIIFRGATMKKKNNTATRPWAALALAGTMAAATPAAFAARTVIDFTGPDSFGATSGLSMPLYTAGCGSNALNGAADTSCNLNLTGNGSAEIALGFNVAIGGTTYGSLFINENGFVTFGSAATSAAQNSGSFADLLAAEGTTPFLAPAVADFTTGSSNPFAFSNGGTGIYYQRGLGVLGASPYSDNDPRATSAFNVIWLTDVGSERFVSQLVLYSLADNGFAAQFNYGDAFGDPNPTLPGGYGGYSLGGATQAFGNAFNDNLAAYRFDGDTGTGGGEDPPPVSVPEPSEIVLLLAALMGLFLATRRRRPAASSGMSLLA
jgi:hypothetical protein